MNMAAAGLKKKENDVIEVKGVLNSDTIMSIMAEGYKFIKSLSRTITFDFSGVIESDSTALALLLAWIRFAKKNGKEILYTHVPTGMIEIAAACRLSNFFSFQVRHK